MKNIILQTIRNKRVALIGFTVGGILIALLYVSLYPSLAKQSDQLDQLMKTFPKEMLKAFNTDSITVIFKSLEGFFSVEDFGLMWPLLTAFFVASIAIGAGIAGEIEKGTMETVLSLPVSRAKIFWGKYCAGTALFAAYSIITIFCVPAFALLFNLHPNWSRFGLFGLIAFLFGMALFSISMVLSSLFSDKGKGYAIVAGMLVAMYAVNIVSELLLSLDKLKYLSFFHYYRPAGPLVDGKIDTLSIAVFASVTVVCSIIALWQWLRRDVAV